MKKNELIKRIFKKTFGLTLYKKIPFGIDPLDDIKFYFPENKINIFFDVGANIGQTVASIREHFQNESIYSFEPFKNTFEILKKNTSTQNVKCFNVGLGAKSGVMSVNTNEGVDKSDLNSILNQPENHSLSEQITITTLNEFCISNDISTIGFLKIDTEGYDLEVLKGGSDMLLNQKIDFIEVELGMNPENKFHIGFEEVKAYLQNHDYRIFGIYSQVLEWPTKSPILRRTDVVFISNTLAKKHTLNSQGFYTINKS